MTSNGTFSVSRTATRRYGVAQRALADPVTLVAVTLFLAVLVAEATFVALNATSVADLSALAAAAGSVT
jgi:hypothetical protein